MTPRLNIRALLVNHATSTNAASSWIIHAQKLATLRRGIAPSSNPVSPLFRLPREVFVHHVAFFIRIVLDEEVPCQLWWILLRILGGLVASFNQEDGIVGAGKI
jgi:hypothetical protein